jgi:hypothetical protein
MQYDLIIQSQAEGILYIFKTSCFPDASTFPQSGSKLNPGDQVHQRDKAGLCHKFPFLPSLIMIWWHSNTTVQSLCFYFTLTPNRDICP